ncbi:MAG: hypothetical protein OEX02_09640, partial [Cyclobacteriaceae bacterium]|nr:hypothetical protein [Cyclobacteriaceae bacterium]
MKQFIYKLLDVEEAQATRVFLMLGMGFFMGIFLATLDVGALSLFLQTFDEGKDLPMAFLLSGVVGIILISIYNFFQSRIPYASLSIISLLAMTIILLGLQFGIKTIADPKNVYFAAFVIVLPFNYLTLLLFWGTFGRIFTLRESKKIIGSIDTGQLIASILALFSIPILLQILEVTDLLSISLLAQGGVLLMVAIIALKKLHAVGGHKRVGRISYPKMLRSKYIVLMAAFVIVSMITISFVDYAFLSATAQQFSPTALPTFLSLFEATVVIFSFLFQTFVTDKVIAQYGLRVALIINPMLIGLFTGIAVFMGIFFGYIKEGNDTFIFFFIIIAMSKLFIDALKDALDGPSFKLYFLPVDTSIRFDVQTKVEGIVTAFAGVLAGLLIITINNVEFFTLLYITIFSLPLLAMWYIITNKMHEGYKSTLQNTLVRNKESQDIEVRQEFSVNQVLENEIKSNKESNIIYSLRLMEKLEPAMFESSIIQMVNSAEGKVREYSLGKIHSLNLQYDKDNEVHQLALKAAGEADDFDAISLPADKLEKMGKSLQKEDRLVAARVLRTMM